MFKYLENVLGSDKKKRKASNEYQSKLIGLKYTHTIAGPSTFFDELDDCHNSLTSLNIFVPDHKMLIQYATYAFEASNFPKFDLTEINREWYTELAKKKCATT